MFKQFGMAKQFGMISSAILGLFAIALSATAAQRPTAKQLSNPSMKVKFNQSRLAQPSTQSTVQPITVQPITVQPTTDQSTTVQPTNAQPTNAQPTTVQPTTVQSTTINPVQPHPAAGSRQHRRVRRPGGSMPTPCPACGMG